MEKEKIIKLIDLLEELGTIEFWEETNIFEYLKTQTTDYDDFELDIVTTCELLVNTLQKKYICNDIDAWKISK